jgi:predicted ester cyclase
MSEPAADASETDGLSIVLRHLEHTDQRQLDRAAADCAADMRIHGLREEALGVAEWRQLIDDFLVAFPDGRFAVDDVLADGDRVAVRQTFRGTQQGVFLGMAPTGRAISVSATVVYRVAGAQIAESWWNADVLGLFRQLNAPPAVVYERLNPQRS